jgi:hypothetical protein
MNPEHPISAAQGRCPHCAGEVITVPRRIGEHSHLQRQCVSCGRGLGFVQRPWTMERARAFVVPFGRFRGATIAELAATELGRGYLHWLSENVVGGCAVAASLVMGTLKTEDLSGE